MMTFLRLLYRTKEGPKKVNPPIDREWKGQEKIVVPHNKGVNRRARVNTVLARDTTRIGTKVSNKGHLGFVNKFLMPKVRGSWNGSALVRCV